MTDTYDGIVLPANPIEAYVVGREQMRDKCVKIIADFGNAHDPRALAIASILIREIETIPPGPDDQANS